jgi:hypothetical protein
MVQSISVLAGTFVKGSLAALGLFAVSAQAIVVDGYYDAAYGVATASVAYNPAAPTSNFGAPTNESNAIAYSIYLNASAGNVYGYLRADPTSGGSSVGAFANVYFDIDPLRAVPNGSDLGFENGAGGARVFVPGLSGPVAAPGVTVAISLDQLGIEFSIPNSYFTGPVAGLTYYGDEIFPTTGDKITLRLSQSFGYSVAGGATYGVDRLGSVYLSAVPEPASWGLIIAGFGLTGAALRRRRLAELNVASA